MRVPAHLISDIKQFIAEGKQTFPLYASSVKAGFPSPAEDYAEQHLDLNRHLIAHPAATFFLRVAGDSMKNAGIFHGDLLIVDRSLEPTSATATEKCRAQQGLAQGICVYITTSRFKKKEEYYSKQRTLMLSEPTHDTRVITHYALMVLETLFRADFLYVKCGIVLLDIIPDTYHQSDLFPDTLLKQNNAVMKAMDNINRKYGKSTIHLASEGFQKAWLARSNRKSPNYMTQWDELAVAVA